MILFIAASISHQICWPGNKINKRKANRAERKVRKRKCGYLGQCVVLFVCYIKENPLCSFTIDKLGRQPHRRAVPSSANFALVAPRAKPDTDQVKISLDLAGLQRALNPIQKSLLRDLISSGQNTGPSVVSLGEHSVDIDHMNCFSGGIFFFLLCYLFIDSRSDSAQILDLLLTLCVTSSELFNLDVP